MAVSWGEGLSFIRDSVNGDGGDCQVTALRLAKGVRELKELHVWPRERWVSPRLGPAEGSWGGLELVSPEGLGSEATFGASPRSRTHEPHPAFFCPAPRSLHGPRAPSIWVGADCPVVCWGLTWRMRKMIDLAKSSGSLLMEAWLPPEHTARGPVFLSREMCLRLAKRSHRLRASPALCRNERFCRKPSSFNSNVKWQPCFHSGPNHGNRR